MNPTIPVAVKFAANGAAFVTNSKGQRLPAYEGVTHADTIALLKFKGYDYRKLTIHGEPTSYPVRR